MSSLASELDFWHFDNEHMVFQDGSFGAGFKIEGFDLTCATESMINQVMKSLENLIASCEEGLKIQIFYQLMPDVQDIIEKHKELSLMSDDNYRRLAQARVSFFSKNQREGSYFVPCIYFFIRSKSSTLRKQSLFSSKESFRQMSRSEYQKKSEQFLRSVKQIESALSSAKLQPTKVLKEEWFSLLFRYLNFERFEKVGVAKYKEPKTVLDESLIEQLTLTDFRWDRNSIQLGNKRFRCLSLATLPEGHSFATMINEFSMLPFHFWISQSIHILDQAKEKASLELKRRIAHSMASGSQNVSDLESENKLVQIEGLLSNLLEGSEKLVSSDLTIIIWGDDDRELDDKSDEVLKAFRQINQAEGLQESLALKESFLNSIPGCCLGHRHKKMKSSNAVHLMPIFASWKGNPRPVCLLPTRDGQLFSLDPYADHLPSWNGIIFGGSGSG